VIAANIRWLVAFVFVILGSTAQASQLYLKDIGLSTVPQLTLHAKSAVTGRRIVSAYSLTTPNIETAGCRKLERTSAKLRSL
jgi:hypothetical protein